MAEIVFGMGSSHGPLLSTPPEQWDLRAKADRENKNHWYRGKTYDYQSLLEQRAPGFAYRSACRWRMNSSSVMGCVAGWCARRCATYRS